MRPTHTHQIIVFQTGEYIVQVQRRLPSKDCCLVRAARITTVSARYAQRKFGAELLEDDAFGILRTNHRKADTDIVVGPDWPGVVHGHNN